MLFTFERYSKLLMDMAVEEPEDQFEAYIETNAALMPISTRSYFIQDSCRLFIPAER